MQVDVMWVCAQAKDTATGGGGVPSFPIMHILKYMHVYVLIGSMHTS